MVEAREFYKLNLDPKTGLPVIWGEFEESGSSLPLCRLKILPDGRKFKRPQMGGKA